jgi:hypothetical protein
MLDDAWFLARIATILIHNAGIELDEVVAKTLDCVVRYKHEDPEPYRERVLALATVRMEKWVNDDK